MTKLLETSDQQIKRMLATETCDDFNRRTDKLIDELLMETGQTRKSIQDTVVGKFISKTMEEIYKEYQDIFKDLPDPKDI